MMSWRSYKTLLKPIFKAISKPGIGNPHTPYEAELMAIGAKPVAIMSPSDITPDLQLAIDKGDVVKTGEKLFREHFLKTQPRVFGANTSRKFGFSAKQCESPRTSSKSC